MRPRPCRAALGLLLGPSDVESLRTLFQRDWERAKAAHKH